MSLRYGVPVPKPLAPRKVKARKDREDAKQLKVFRDAVWARQPMGVTGIANCEFCGCRIWREHLLPHGDVHHRIGRRAKATRYDPTNGVLLCPKCHRAAQEHRITV